ncbi:ankyrin repeat protein [Elysia marginata]|uniref:Ankyrin repeat protein n=1 Tax=Elysia marginata TaxID=1093978 RepID=A0AAV4HY07_9GAST|nr:ankyrin repeat protein [Elysia marginata]
MDDLQLSEAINENDINQIKQLLMSRQCSPNQDRIKLTPVSVIECVTPRSSRRASYRAQSGAKRFNATFGFLNGQEDVRKCEILKVLVQYGADVNVQADPCNCLDISYSGLTPAMCATRYGFYKCLEFLVEYGADLEIISEDNETILTIAVMEGREDCVNLLLKHMPSSSVNNRDIHGRSALMIATLSPGSTSISCMQQLIAAGAKLDLADGDGDTALTFAIFSKNVAAVDLLLHNGAVVNTLSSHGETPLTYAMRYFDNRIIINLLRSGADPTLSGLDRDCLHETLGREHNSVVRALLMHGFPPLELRLVNLDKFTMSTCASDFLLQLKLIDYLRTTPLSPLALALLQNRTDIARYFIANEYFTRFDVVQLCWDQKIRRLLLDSKAHQSLEIIHLLSARPQSLFNLSLIAVSSALSQDLVSDPSPDDMKYWTFKPTFKEKVELSGLPPALQRALLHQRPLSGICCQKWDEIALGEAENIPARCHCKECDGTVRKKSAASFIDITI